MRPRLPPSSAPTPLFAHLARLVGACALFAVGLVGCGARGPETPATGEDPNAPVFYPAAPDTPRIQFLATYSREEDVTGGRTGFQRFVLGDQQEQALGIIKPYGVAISQGHLLVCDMAWRRVWELDVPGKIMGALGGGDGASELRKPVNVSVDADGTRYVVDVGVRRVLVYDNAGRFLRAFGDPEKFNPTSVAVGPDVLYVTDTTAGQISVHEKATGAEIARYASRGSNDGQLFLPTNVAIGPNGDLFVSDTGNFRVARFDRDGKFVRNYGSLGRAPGQFARPKGVAVDRAGRLYVVDTAFENVQLFDAEGRLLLFFGTPGAKRGAMNVPAAAVIDYENVGVFADRVAPGRTVEYLILVTSQYGPNKVNVYGFLKEPGAPAP